MNGTSMTEREINIQKQVSHFLRRAEVRAKQENCVLCGSKCLSFANSHSVPRFVIKRIAVEGKLKTFSDIVGMHNNKNGVNNSWTFHIICSSCENKYFSAYESEASLLKEPTNIMMAQIALKDSLLMLHKYRIDCESNKEAIKIGAFVGETDVLPIMNTLDIADTCFEIKRSKKIIDNKLKSGYKLIYHRVLDWVSPIAFQSEMCLYRNIDGTIINQIYSESKDVRMQELHVGVYPLKAKTVVMVFAHKDDRNYVAFDRQFQRLEDNEKLEYVNYLIFKYTEHALISPSIDPIVLKADKLVKLCKQGNHNDFGYGEEILPCEIPNFLSKEYSLPN